MPRNNGRARREQRRLDAQHRAARPVVACVDCGRRHAASRGCWGHVQGPVNTRGRAFRAVVHRMARKATRWAWRMVGR